MEKLMYCHSCYASFDNENHKPAQVLSKDITKEVANICQACHDKNQMGAGGKIGRTRIPLDKNVKSFYLAQFANGSSPVEKMNSLDSYL